VATSAVAAAAETSAAEEAEATSVAAASEPRARRWLAPLALVALLLVLAPSARAQGGVSAASEALRDDPVYVDPAAELADQVDAAALRSRIAATGAPIFVAVLPASATEGSAGRTLVALREAVGEEGTYALAVGDEFRTLSDAFEAAGPGEAARAAHPDDLQATLIAFIDRAGRERTRARDSGSPLGALVAVGALVLVVLGGAALIVSRRHARDGRSEVGEIDQTDDFVRLGDSIRALELDITLGEAGPAAKADYDRALEAYDRANAHDRRGEDESANRALDEGLAAIASARERIAGRR